MSSETENQGGMGAGWWAAGAVVVAVVAGLVFLLVSPGDSGDEDAAEPTSTATPKRSPAEPRSTGSPTGRESPSSAAGERGCRGSADTKKPTAAPKGVTWEPLAGGSVPVSKELGPTKVDGPLRHCYQRSPSGALLAASNMLQSSFTANSAATKVFSEQMTPGQGRTGMLNMIANEPDEADSAAEPVGFRFGACTPKECQVNIAFVESGTYAQYKVSVVWAGGDWKLDGRRMIADPAVSQQPPTGFVVWSPSS